MLKLSRRKNEGIVINDQITVTVVEVRGDKVKLGIKAPREIPVHRQEVQDALQGGPKKVLPPWGMLQEATQTAAVQAG